jgi:hypothetical protein
MYQVTPKLRELYQTTRRYITEDCNLKTPIVFLYTLINVLITVLEYLFS